MKTSQKQASARLFKKLSALRATLSNEERDILDNLIRAEEVSAHKMNLKIVGKATTKAVEVAAHKMTSNATGKVADKAALRIAFDTNSEGYKVQE